MAWHFRGIVRSCIVVLGGLNWTPLVLSLVKKCLPTIIDPNCDKVLCISLNSLSLTISFRKPYFLSSQTLINSAGHVTGLSWMEFPVLINWKKVTHFIVFKYLLNILWANSGDPDQTPHSVAPDLDPHCFPMSHIKDVSLVWIKIDIKENLKMSQREIKHMLVFRGLAKQFASFFCYCNTPCLEWTIKFIPYLSNKEIFITLAKWIAWLDHINVNTARKLTMYIILKTSEAWTCTRYKWFPYIYIVIR